MMVVAIASWAWVVSTLVYWTVSSFSLSIFNGLCVRMALLKLLAEEV